jgi:hypothetical protein
MVPADRCSNRAEPLVTRAGLRDCSTEQGTAATGRSASPSLSTSRTYRAQNFPLQTSASTIANTASPPFGKLARIPFVPVMLERWCEHACRGKVAHKEREPKLAFKDRDKGW